MGFNSGFKGLSNMTDITAVGREGSPASDNYCSQEKCDSIQM